MITVPFFPIWHKASHNIYIKNDKGRNVKVGIAYPHRKGNGFQLIIGNQRLTAFPAENNFADKEESA